jgi:hypothetical protein
MKMTKKTFEFHLRILAPSSIDIGRRLNKAKSKENLLTRRVKIIQFEDRKKETPSKMPPRIILTNGPAMAMLASDSSEGVP